MDGFDKPSFDLSSSPTATATAPPQPKPNEGGLAGFVKGVGKSIASPFEYLGRAAIVNPAREIAATVNHNPTALANANQASNKNLGLGDNGTNIGEATKRFLGNTGQALLTVAAPEVNSIKGGAAVGAGFGGASALAQPNSTATNVINQTALGAVIGGGASLAGKVFSSGINKLNNSSTEMEARAAGIGTGEKVAGQSMKVGNQEDLLKWAQDHGMPAGKARDMAQWAETQQNTIGQQLQSAVSKIDQPLTDAKRLDLVNQFRDSLNSDITLRNNPAAQKLADQISTGISEIDSLGKQVGERRNLQDAINFSRNAASPDPMAEKVYDTARRVLNEDINAISPEVKAINADYNKVSQLQDGVLGAAGRLTRASEAGGGGGGLTNMALKGDTAQTAKSVVGRFGRNITDKIQNAADSASNVIPKTGLAANPVDALALKKDSTGGTDTTNAPANLNNLLSSSGNDSTTAGVPSKGTSPFNSDAIQRAVAADVVANGGKNVGTLISLYNTFGKPDKPSTADTTLASGIQSALASLDAAEGNLSTAGGAKGPFKGSLAKIPVVGQYANPQGNVYEQTKADTALQLAKALSGSARAPQGIFEYVLHSLPSVTDTPTVASGKLQKLRNEVMVQAQKHGIDPNTGNIAQ